MRRRPKNRITIDDVRFEFSGDAALPDAIDEIDVEYTELMCTNLMGCAEVSHEAMTLEHLKNVLASDNGNINRGDRYKGATLTTQPMCEGSNKIQYAEEGGKIYVRARINPTNRDEWTLMRA
jgi:hypothetical protein